MRNSISQCLSILVVSLFFLTITPTEGAQPFPPSMQASGVLKPSREVTLSSEILSKVDSLTVKEGGYFKKGAVLLRFDCMGYRATTQLPALPKYKNRYVKLGHPQLAEVYEEDSGTQNDPFPFETAQRNVKFAAVAAAMRNCVIRAPWNGRVEKILVHPHEMVKPGDALLQIFDDSLLDIEFKVPSSWVVSLKVGAPFLFHVSDTGKDYFPKITSIGGRVDPATGTVALTGSLIKSHVTLLAGMQGLAKFGNFEPKMSINPATLYVLLHKQHRLECVM